MTAIKAKGLFDHIKQITDVQNPNYWDDISDEDGWKLVRNSLLKKC